MCASKKFNIPIILSLVIVILLLLASISTGSYTLSINKIFDIIIGVEENTMDAMVFFTLRLPRVLMGLLAGFALGLAGGIYQLMFRNPLASPDLTGIASGASLGAALAIIFGAGNISFIVTGSFLGGLSSLVILLSLVKLTGGKNTSSYLLSGVIVSSFSNAGIMILKSMADPESQLASIEFWLMGSLADITDDKLLSVVFVITIPMVLLLLLHKQILMLSLGQDIAKSMGLSPTIHMISTLALSTLMISAVVCITGVIGFVGLIAPHIAYMILRKRSGCFLVFCGLIGSIITLFADIVARSASNGTEIPVSIPIILLSLPIMILLLRKNRYRI